MSGSEPVREAYSALAQPYIDLVDGGAWQDDPDDTDLVRRHLTALDGPVLDLGCGPGQWSAYLHSLGVEVTGVDLVGEFVAHARSHHPGPTFRLGSMDALDLPDHSVAGILSWFSTIHLAPSEIEPVLAELRRLLVLDGVLVIGFFAGDDVGAFDHRVVTAYRWPVGVLAGRLAAAGFVELERRTHPAPLRRDRTHAALALRAS